MSSVYDVYILIFITSNESTEKLEKEKIKQETKATFTQTFMFLCSLMFYSVLALIPLTTVRVFLPFRQALLVISTADFDVLFVSHKLPTYLLTTNYGVLIRAAMQSAITSRPSVFPVERSNVERACSITRVGLPQSPLRTPLPRGRAIVGHCV